MLSTTRRSPMWIQLSKTLEIFRNTQCYPREAIFDKAVMDGLKGTIKLRSHWHFYCEHKVVSIK